MTKILVDVNDAMLAEAMELLGTTTKKDTVNLALEEVVARLRRARAFDELAALFDSGRLDFSELEKEWD
jgi:Arc/MetJ family transcription regulator